MINWNHWQLLKITIPRVVSDSSTAGRSVLQLALLLELHVGHAARTYLAMAAVPQADQLSEFRKNPKAQLSMAQPPLRLLRGHLRSFGLWWFTWPTHPPAFPCVPLRPLGTWTNVKLPPYLHRTGGHHCFSHSDHHCYCFVFLRSGKAAHLQDIPKHDSHLLRFFEIHAKLPACPVGFTSEYENPVLDIAISSAINGDVTIATSHNPPTWSGRPQQHGTGGLLHTDVGGCWHQQLGECLHRLKTTSDLVLSNSRSPWEKYVMTCHDPIALTDLRYPVTGSTTLERATGLKIMVLRMVLQKRLKTIGRMIFTVVSW